MGHRAAEAQPWQGEDPAYPFLSIAVMDDGGGVNVITEGESLYHPIIIT